jgi:shikimate dehydrogenase
MDRYVVAGNPVEHSQSPFIHAEFARQTGQAIEYGRVLWPLDGFADSVRALAESGAKGCNITVPFKFDAARVASRLSERAALAQAANVLSFDAEGWRADNTDGIGLVADIEHNARVPLAGKRVLLIGAGGAAAGVLGPLLAAGPREVVVANRSEDKARALVERHRELGPAALRASTLAGCGVAFVKQPAGRGDAGRRCGAGAWCTGAGHDVRRRGAIVSRMGPGARGTRA